MPDRPTIPTSLYIHIPWCVKKCPYCDFNSHALKVSVDEQHTFYQHYFDALLADLKTKLALHNHPQIHSIFFGGGTPSLTPGTIMKRFMQALRQHTLLAENTEITLEANPGAVDQASFDAYRDAGINRLSIGAQSFSSAQLQTLGRIHNPEQIIEAAKAALRAGFSNLNLDIMFALPKQHREQALDDIQQAIALKPSHISAYQLTIEANTVFSKQAPAGLPDNDQASEIQAAVTDCLSAAGYTRYEISAYSQPGSSCQHNLNYWQFGDYIAIGAGAHGKLTSFGSEGELTVTRYMNQKHPQSYLRYFAGKTNTSLLQSEQTSINRDQLRFEYLMNALRLTEGFQLGDYSIKTGESAESFMQWLTKKNLLSYFSIQTQQVRLNAQAYPYIDTILEKCLPEN